MAARTFEAPDRAVWSVWEVIPGRVSEFRSSFGPHLPRDLADGWLCFDCGTEKRRLAPLPRDWAERPEQDLLFWCRAAAPVVARPGQAVSCDASPASGEADSAAAAAAATGGELAAV